MISLLHYVVIYSMINNSVFSIGLVGINVIRLCVNSPFSLKCTSFSSSAPSLFAGPLINKTYSRYWDSFFSIDQITRLLLLFFILGNLSFAVSSNLVGEISALIGLFPIDSLWLVSYLLSRFLSTFFRSLILNRKLPYHSCYSPSNYIEFSFSFFFSPYHRHFIDHIWFFVSLVFFVNFL